MEYDLSQYTHNVPYHQCARRRPAVLDFRPPLPLRAFRLLFRRFALSSPAGLLRRGSGFGWRYWAFLGEDTESGRSKGREPGFYNQLAT